MRLVDDDREAASALLAADLVQNERELLHRGDDDLLPLGDELAKLVGSGAALGGRTITLGVDRFGESGSLADLYRTMGIGADDITRAAEALLDLDSDA